MVRCFERVCHRLGGFLVLAVSLLFKANPYTYIQMFVGLRIREEEKMLQRELGKEYKDYMNNVPARLLPYLL